MQISRWRTASLGALVTGSLAAATLIGAPAAYAVAPCVAGTVTTGAHCTLPAGASIILVLKGGNGGAGGQGGAGGAGGTGWTGAATVNGGSGGAGGPGGAGGAGAKSQTTYTNTTGAAVTLDFTIGASGTNGTVGTIGATGTSYSSGSAQNGGVGVSGTGGTGGDGGDDTVVTVASTAIATALGANGGNGGTGGAGGEGGQSSGTVGRSGTTGSAGAAGADATGGNLSTSNAEAPSITLSFPPTPSGTPGVLSVTLTLDPNGGSCTVQSLTGDATTWIALPQVGECHKAGAVLAGWQPQGSAKAFLPGVLVQLTNDNALFAVWADLSTPTAEPPTPFAKVHMVVWNSTGTEVRAGTPAALKRRTPVITVVTKHPTRVSSKTVAAARRLAVKYDGVYGGVVTAKTWRTPRIVATYLT